MPNASIKSRGFLVLKIKFETKLHHMEMDFFFQKVKFLTYYLSLKNVFKIEGCF